MSTPSAHLLHLLGRWQDTRLVFEAIPNRLDFFKNGKKEPPSIVVNRLEICKTANHRHFPNTETSTFPTNPVRTENHPEAENYNWQPWLRENRLWNWNLEEEIEEDQQHMRRRRQAPVQENVETPLLGHNNLIKLICRENSLKSSIKKPYSFFAATLVNQTWNKKIIPAVQDHFQYVWSDTQTWNVEMKQLGETNFYNVIFVVPPFCKVFFSDVSVMQALGFDSVGLGFQKDKFSIRSHKQKSGAMSYFWHNNSNTARTYISVRPIENLPIYKLRIEAKKARQKLSEEAKTKSPDIIHEREELDTTFDTTYEFTPALMDPIQSEFPGVEKLDNPTNPADNVVLFEDYFKFLLKHLSVKLGLDPTVFKVTANEPDPESVVLTYTRTTANTPDRLTVEIDFGEETAKIFKYLRLYNKIEWNLGRQNPYIQQVVGLSGQKKKDYDRAESQRRADAKRKKAEAVAKDTLVGKPAQVQDPKPKIAAADDVIKGHQAEIQDPQITPTQTQPQTPAIKIKEQQGGAEGGAAGGVPTGTTVSPEDVIKLNVRANVGDGTQTAQIPAATADVIKLKVQANVGEGTTQDVTGNTEPGAQDEINRKKQEKEELDRQEAERQKQEKEKRDRDEAERQKQEKEKRDRDEAERIRKEKDKKARDEAEKQKKEKEKRDNDEAERQRQAKEKKEREERDRQRQEQADNDRAEEERQRQDQENRDRQRQEQEDNDRAEEERQRQDQENRDRQRQEQEDRDREQQRLAEEELERQREEAQRGQQPDEDGDADDDDDDDDPNVNPVILPDEEQPQPEPEPFTRERNRFLVGNAVRKRRWPGQEDEATLPAGLLLVLENALQENDFITDYGRCCVAATIIDRKVVTKNRCYLNLDFTEQITFQVFDSQHLTLVKVPNDQLVKIEILLYA